MTRDDAMHGDISLAAGLWFHIPLQVMLNLIVLCGMLRYCARAGRPPWMTGTNPGNFSRDGVSQPTALHRTRSSHGRRGLR
jgi:hypothetical protein